MRHVSAFFALSNDLTRCIFSAWPRLCWMFITGLRRDRHFKEMVLVRYVNGVRVGFSGLHKSGKSLAAVCV